MKKLLSILGAAGLVATSASSVVACGTSSNNITVAKWDGSTKKINVTEKYLSGDSNNLSINITEKMSINKGSIILKRKDDDGSTIYVVAGRTISENDTSWSFNGFGIMPTKDAITGKKVDDSECVYPHFKVNLSELKGKMSPDHSQVDLDNIGNDGDSLFVLNDDIDSDISFSFAFNNVDNIDPDVHNDSKGNFYLSMAELSSYETDKDDDMSVVHDLFDITISKSVIDKYKNEHPHND